MARESEVELPEREIKTLARTARSRGVVGMGMRGFRVRSNGGHSELPDLFSKCRADCRGAPPTTSDRSVVLTKLVGEKIGGLAVRTPPFMHS